MAGLKGSLYATNPETAETTIFPAGTARKDLPKWVKVDDGAFEVDPGGEAPAAYPEGDPSEEWTGAQLDAYADAKGVDISSAKNKAEKAAALLDAQK